MPNRSAPRPRRFLEKHIKTFRNQAVTAHVLHSNLIRKITAVPSNRIINTWLTHARTSNNQSHIISTRKSVAEFRDCDTHRKIVKSIPRGKARSWATVPSSSHQPPLARTGTLPRLALPTLGARADGSGHAAAAPRREVPPIPHESGGRRRWRGRARPRRLRRRRLWSPAPNRSSRRSEASAARLPTVWDFDYCLVLRLLLFLSCSGLLLVI
jgi:hypothetical protein